MAARREIGARATTIRRGRALALAGVLVLSASAASAESATKPMPWEDCLATKADMQAKLDVKADRVINIVNSAALTVTRVCTSGGAVSISCSKAGQTLIVTVRPQSELSCLWRSLVNTPT